MKYSTRSFGSFIFSFVDFGTLFPLMYFVHLWWLEWQKAIYSVGGAEMKSWTLHLRRSMTEGMSVGTNGASLQQQEMNLIQERPLPSSPSPLYSPHSKTSGYMKGGLGPSTARKQVMGGHAGVESPRGLLQWVQTISFVTVSVDHSLNLVFPVDVPSPGKPRVYLSIYPPSSWLKKIIIKEKKILVSAPIKYSKKHCWLTL